MHRNQRVKPRPEVIDDNSHPPRKAFQTTDRRRFQNVEPTKKYKAQQQRFPRDGNRYHREQLAGDFINHDKLRIFDAGCGCHASCGWNAEQCHG